MEKIKKWFLHNPLLKLVSLVIAFLLWLFVVNTSNPKITASVTVPFDVLNEKAILTSNQIYVTNTSDVTISFNVRTKYKNQVTPDAFSAYINMEDYSITGAVPVYIEIDSSVSELISDVTVEPSVVHVTTEEIQQKEFEIESYVIGEPAEGYKAGELTLYPESLYVKGPVSLIGQITTVGVTINIEGATLDQNGTVTAAFYDANGNLLTGIEDSLSFAGDVNYSMPIYRIKSLTVNAFLGGAPASGYTVDSVETSPTFISVYGPEEILEKHSYIIIPGNDLNVSGIKENKTFNVSAEDYIPEGLKLANQSSEITVYVKVKSIYENKGDSDTPSDSKITHSSEPETTTAAESSSVPESTSETAIKPTEVPESTSLEETSDTENESESETEETEPQEGEETLPQAQ